MAEESIKFNSGTFKNIFSMSRPPFHIVGVMPFILGTVLANRLTGAFNLAVFLIATFAVIMIMLLTYYNGEYYDVKEDKIAGKGEKNLFSGGSQVIAQKRLPRKYAKIGSYIALALAVIAGLVLQFYYKTGVWTVPLGALGMFLGYFYSSPPFRWVSRGIGEMFIGFCYGWLTLAAAFYIQTQRFDALINWASVPVALTIFNVILINEFPDYNADKLAGKRNIVVRLGKSRSAIIYITATVLTWVFFGLSVFAGVPVLAVYIFIPFFLASCFIIISLIRKVYIEHKKLEMLCGLTIIINIGVTLSLILGISFGM